jgi:hypothetical protein
VSQEFRVSRVGIQEKYPETPVTNLSRQCTILGAILLLFGSTGCMSWHAAPVSTAPSVASTIRLRLADGRRVDLTDAFVRNDSIVGHPWNAPSDVRVAFAQSDVRSAEARRINGLLTIVTLLGTFAILFGVVTYA